MRVRGFLIVMGGVMLACGDVSTPRETVPDGEAYFPLAVGRSWTYAVDSIVLDDAPGGNVKDTVNFQLREDVVAVTVGATGDTTFILHRFRRNTEADPWLLRDVWTAARAGHEALRTEENVTFVKMTFPIRPDNSWVSTAYVSPSTTVRVGTEFLEPFDYWESAITAVDVDAVIGDLEFAEGQVMHIRQVDADDGLTKRTVLESYARNVGLVSRIDTILDSRCIVLGDFGPCIGKPWLQHAAKGYMLKQTLIAYR